MWTESTRKLYCNKNSRYTTDLTDAQWALLEPLFSSPAKRRGRPPKTPLREVVNALLYMVRSGCTWRLLPKDFPPFTTVQNYFYRWRDSRLLLQINHLLVMQDRELSDREASPTACIIDSQSVKTTESGGPSGFDAGKKIKGRKRHIATDTEGRLLMAVLHTADIQDRDGGPVVIQALKKIYPWVQCIFADGGYAGEKFAAAVREISKTVHIEVIKRSDKQKGFHVLARRWVVERTFGWLSRNRRLAKDFEKTITSSETWLMLAHVAVMVRRTRN